MRIQSHDSDHCGRAGNVDSDSSRSRIRRFDVTSIPDGGVAFSSGELFADGLRNEVGLAFDRHGVLWGVENGADNLQRSDLGGDITNENPGLHSQSYTHVVCASSEPEHATQNLTRPHHRRRTESVPGVSSRLSLGLPLLLQ